LRKIILVAKPLFLFGLHVGMERLAALKGLDKVFGDCGSSRVGVSSFPIFS
jgi:hypothetical protein